MLYTAVVAIPVLKKKKTAIAIEFLALVTGIQILELWARTIVEYCIISRIHFYIRMKSLIGMMSTFPGL